MPNLEIQRILYYEFQCQKLLRLYHNTYILSFYKDLSTKLYRVYDLTIHSSLSTILKTSNKSVSSNNFLYVKVDSIHYTLR